MKRILLIIALLFSVATAQTRYSWPLSVESSSGRPLNAQTVAIFDTTGTLYKNLVYETGSPGRYYSTTAIANGVYTLKLYSGGVWRTVPGHERINIEIYGLDQLRAIVGDSVNALAPDNVTVIADGTIKQKVFNDTTALKLAAADSAGMTVILKQLASGNAYGGGTFVWKTSGYSANGVTVFAATGGYWVREEYLKDNRTTYTEWFGVKPDGTTNNATALNNAVEKTIAIDATKLIFPRGTIRSDSEISFDGLSVDDITLEGAGMWNTTLDFSNANTGGINVDPSVGSGYSNNVKIKKMSIVGNGKASNDYAGITIDSTTWSEIEDCRIASFEYGIKLVQPNSVRIKQCYITSHVWGIHMANNPNANSFHNITVSQCDSAGIYQINGQTNTIYNLEAANNFRTIYAATGAKMTLIGGNIEQGVNGGVDIYVKGTLADVSLINTRGLSSGLTNLFAWVQGSSRLNMWNCIADGYNMAVAGQHIYIVNHTADLVTHNDPRRTKLIRAYWAAKGMYFYPASDLSLPDDVGMSANSTNRGHNYNSLVRSGFTIAEDKQTMVRQTWNGTYTDTWYANIDHYFSTDGATFGRTYGIADWEGYKTFASDADSATDVTVTVDSLNLIYGISAIVYDNVSVGKSYLFIPTVLSYVEGTSAGSGTIVFRIWHPFHRQGETGLKLYYRIVGRRYY